LSHEHFDFAVEFNWYDRQWISWRRHSNNKSAFSHDQSLGRKGVVSGRRNGVAALATAFSYDIGRIISLFQNQPVNRRQFASVMDLCANYQDTFPFPVGNLTVVHSLTLWKE
jgi:hypothetical protein